MSDLPKSISITEEAPREGFQFEAAPVETARKIELIDALSRTGLERIQVASFVHPKAVPNMADAEAVASGITPAPGVAYSGLWLNGKGFERAVKCPGLTLTGYLTLSASRTFLKRNQNKTPEEQTSELHGMAVLYARHGVPIRRLGITAAFGCNFEGDVPIRSVLERLRHLQDIAESHDGRPDEIALFDTMGWATPLSVKRVVEAVRRDHPSQEIMLHLHDTRGLAIANAFAGLEMGVSKFESCVGGLGGCPFAGNAGAAGNVCTEDLVFMCEQMGIRTGLDLGGLVACASLAERIVGHPLPGSILRGGYRYLERVKSA